MVWGTTGRMEAGMAWQQTGLRKRSIAIGPTEVVLVSEVAG